MGALRARSWVLLVVGLAALAGARRAFVRQQEDCHDGDSLARASSPNPSADLTGPALAAGGGSAASGRRAASAPAASLRWMPLPSWSTAPRPLGDYVAGVVADEAGRPVPSARVRYLHMDHRGNPTTVVAAETTADPAGRFLLPTPPCAPWTDAALEAVAGDLRAFRPFAESERLEPLLRLNARRTRVVTGTVLDAETGRTLDGAAVLLWPERSWGWTCALRTGPEGAFQVEAIEGETRLSAWHEGYAFTGIEVPTETGSRTLRIALARAATGRVRGRVLRGGAPASGVLVELLDVHYTPSEGLVSSTRTDALGGFEMEAVTARDYALRATLADERADEICRLNRGIPGATADDASCTLTLEPALVVSGRVTRAGQPAPGLRVASQRNAPREIHEGRTGPDGMFRLTGMRRPQSHFAGWIDVEAPEGHYVARYGLSRGHVGGVVAQPLDLPALRRIHGHVRAEDGRLVPRATVIVRDGRQDDGRQWAGSADGEGRFDVLVPTDAELGVLRVRAPGFATGWVRDLPPGQGTLDVERHVVLAAGGSLLGRIVDERGEAVEGAIVVVSSEGGGTFVGEATANAEGLWSVCDAVGERFRVRAHAEVGSDTEGRVDAEIRDAPTDVVVPDLVVCRRSEHGAK